jgi:glycosyltransferase involved in cell wall biosynthesis
MRILHVVPTYWPAVRYGGPIRSVHALARGLVERGHDVHVFTTNADGNGNSAVPLQRAVDIEGVQVTYFPTRWLRRLYWSPAMANALATEIRSFDIAHLHSVFLWPTWAAARLASAQRVPYVLAPRGMLVPELIHAKSRWVKNAWIALIERRNVTSAAAIHATSDLEAEDLKRFGWALPRVAVIPNGVDEPVDLTGQPISQDVAAAIGQTAFILSLGRIVWVKGLERLIAALPEAPKVRLVLAGNDPEDYAMFLTREAARLGVADRVVVLARHIEGADKEALFRAARGFAMPSLSENFGIAAIEAMRRGLPVIVTPEVGVADLVRKSAGGIVVAGETSSIALGMKRLMADPSGAHAMGRAGQTYVTARYNWASVAGRMEALYESLLSGDFRAQSAAHEPVEADFCSER